MQCPVCKSPKTRVIDSRAGTITVWRKRECTACHATFYSVEAYSEHTAKYAVGVRKKTENNGNK